MLETGTDGINTTMSDWFHTNCYEGRDNGLTTALTRESEKSSVSKLHLSWYKESEVAILAKMERSLAQVGKIVHKKCKEEQADLKILKEN